MWKMQMCRCHCLVVRWVCCRLHIWSYHWRLLQGCVVSDPIEEQFNRWVTSWKDNTCQMREHLCLSKAFCPDYRYTLYLLYTSGLSLKSLILSQRVIGVVLLTLALFWDFAEWFNKTLAQWKDSTQEVEGCVCFFIKNTFFRLCIYFISSVMVHSSDNIPTFIINFSTVRGNCHVINPSKL